MFLFYLVIGALQMFFDDDDDDVSLMQTLRFLLKPRYKIYIQYNCKSDALPIVLPCHPNHGR